MRASAAPAGCGDVPAAVTGPPLAVTLTREGDDQKLGLEFDSAGGDKAAAVVVKAIQEGSAAEGVAKLELGMVPAFPCVFTAFHCLSLPFTASP